MGKKLKKKPLVEAIVELRWGLREVAKGVLQDPAYPLFLGRLHERVRKDYPYVEPLPSAHVPDELTPYVVKYRFRAAKDGWPLVQAGPGVATMNFTQSYDWDSFLGAAKPFFANLVDAYAVDEAAQPPRFVSVLLRYINAVELDATKVDALAYMGDKLHTQFSLPEGITATPEISGPPQGLQMSVQYALTAPRAVASIGFSTGDRRGKPSLLWELTILSTNDDAPADAAAFETWLGGAHDIVEKWFFALIEGELDQAFNGGE